MSNEMRQTDGVNLLRTAFLASPLTFLAFLASPIETHEWLDGYAPLAFISQVIWRLRRNHVFSIFCSKLLDRMISIVYVSGKALREPSVSVEYQTESIWWNPRIRIGGERGALVACLPVFHVLNQLTHLRASSSSNLTLLCTCMCRWKLVFHSILIGSTFSLEFLHYDSRPMDWFIIITITLKREESDVWWRTTNSQKSSNGSVFWYCAP